jgi:hypothetical protein
MKPSGTLHVNILKVPHHGSSNNVDDDFFERISADHYVFSGDGEHGNPERETLEMLFRARGRAPFELHLTYPIVEIDALRKEEWMKQQAAEKAKAVAGGPKPRKKLVAGQPQPGSVLQADEARPWPVNPHRRREEVSRDRLARAARVLISRRDFESVRCRRQDSPEQVAGR